MLRSRFLQTMIALLMLGNCAVGKGFVDGEITARDYSYKSATFGMGLSDFEKQFNVGLPIEANSAAQTATHQIVASQGKIMRLEFHNGRLTKIWAYLTAPEVARVGGQQVVEKKMVETFGRPHVIQNGAFAWNYPNVNRCVAYTTVDGVAAIMVEDTSPQTAVSAEQNSDVDLGF